MRIDSLRLQNFRGFQDLEIKFPNDPDSERVNNAVVFIGINGAGKSSVLDALAILLSRFAAKLTDTDPRSGAFPFTEDDFNFKANTFALEVTLTDTDENRMNFFFEVSRSDGNSRGIKGDTDYIKHLKEKLVDNQNLSLPILVYYRTNRFISEQAKDYQTKTKAFDFPQLYMYKGAFFKRFSSFDDFVIWFTAEEDLENQIISREDRGYVNPNLQVIRETIETFFSTLTSSKFSNLRVNRSRKNSDFRFQPGFNTSLEIHKDSDVLKITELSDGEKSLLIIVCDVARRLAIANPSLSNPREGEGIVLIDEIDAHLHPQWQREILPALQTTFPQCQFITTTHSPQVLSNLRRESIFILEDWQVIEENPHSYGRDTNSILYEYMGVEERPRWMRNKLDTCFHHIDQGEIEKAKELLAKVKELIGDQDSEMVRANTMLAFMVGE